MVDCLPKMPRQNTAEPLTGGDSGQKDEENSMLKRYSTA